MKRLPIHGLDPESHADGEVVTIVAGKAAWSPPSDVGGYLVPVTIEVDGEFGFVWLDDGQLVMTGVI